MPETTAETTDVPAIRTRALTRVYGDRRAVDALDLEVPQGLVFGFLGPNGAGKSTTIRMLLGLVRPTAGACEVLGRPVRPGRAAWRREIGALIESPAFWDHLSGRDNLRQFMALSATPDARAIDEALELVGLADRAEDRVAVYSHGMRQRLGIARALLPRPRVVILDEPGDGLDPEGIRDIRGLVRRLAHDEGMTVFLSSHLLDEVERACDRIAVLHRGSLRFTGGVQDLLRAAVRTEIVAGDPDRAARALADAVPDVTVERDPEQPDILTADCDEDRVPDLVDALVAAGVSVRRAGVRRRTLEEAFFDLTGEQVRP